MALGGLSSIRPEIHDFISRENRSHADPWLQQVLWVEHELTLALYVQRPATWHLNTAVGVKPPSSWDSETLLATLTRPSLLKIYFPPSLDDKPFCFCEDDVLVPATQAANERLRPLSCNSVLSVVTTALQCVKREFPHAQEALSMGSTAGADRGQSAAEAVLAAVKKDPLGADLVLALLSMAVSSYRRDTVSTPFPRQLESSDLKRAYAAFVSCLEDIPSMVEMSKWADAGQVLKLPPVAVIALHFVLVALPVRLRTPNGTDNGNGGGSGEEILRSGPRGGGYRDDGAEQKNMGCAVAVSRRAETVGEGSLGLGTAVGRNGSGGGSGGVSQLGEVPSHVFDVVLPSDPAFDAEAARSGSKVAYHGSSPENFHSILNTGLTVMSGSRLMKNGAAFGEGIYLSGSRKAAAAFACRGDGSGTTVWPRSAFGNNAAACGAAATGGGGGGGGATMAGTVAATKSEGAAAAKNKFQHRLVAKCRVLKGHGVKEIEGWGDESSYFVVSDASRVRVEALLLFHEGQTSEQIAPGAAAAPPAAGRVDRARMGGSRLRRTDGDEGPAGGRGQSDGKAAKAGGGGEGGTAVLGRGKGVRKWLHDFADPSLRSFLLQVLGAVALAVLFAALRALYR